MSPSRVGRIYQSRINYRFKFRDFCIIFQKQVYNKWVCLCWPKTFSEKGKNFVFLYMYMLVSGKLNQMQNMIVEMWGAQVNFQLHSPSNITPIGHSACRFGPTKTKFNKDRLPFYYQFIRYLHNSQLQLHTCRHSSCTFLMLFYTINADPYC